MSILLSYICNQPKRLQSALEPMRENLKASGVTRWGLGYAQGQEILLSLHPRAVRNEFDFFTALARVHADHLLSVAATDREYSGTTNTQPFRFHHWMFALESDIANFKSIHADLVTRLPGFLRRNIKGQTPAEYVFHVFLRLLHDSSQIHDHNVDMGQCASALRTAVHLVETAVEKAGLLGRLGNIVLSNSRCMLCVRLAGPLYVRRLSYFEDIKRPDTEFRSVLTLGCTSPPGEGFEELPIRTILKVGRDISTDMQSW